MARIPGIDSAVGAARTAAGLAQPVAQHVAGRALTTSLIMVGSVTTRVTGVVTGTVDTATQARDTVQALHRLAIRAEMIVAELEEPLIALKPGLLRLAAVLDDPTISEVPETLRRVQDDVLPVLRTLADTHEKVAMIAGSTERIMAFVDDTGRTIAHLPGAGLLGRATSRKPSGAGRTVIVEELEG